MLRNAGNVCLYCFLIGCATSPAIQPNTQTSPVMIKSELYFGRSIPTGGEVSRKAWERFVTKIGRCFPQGFTVLDGAGRWKNQRGGVDRERSEIVIGIYEQSPETRACIDDLKSEYKREFSQEAVLEVDYRVAATF